MIHRCGSLSAARDAVMSTSRWKVVHAEVRADHRDDDERHPDETRERQVQGRRGADRDDDRNDELRDRGAEVAAGGVESEGVTLLRGR